MKVLLIDDSLIVVARLMTMLSDIQGIEIVGQAHNIGEGRALFFELKPDVVILDIQMPGGSGIDLLSHIKKDSPRTIVVMLTNFPYQQYKNKCHEAGADHFFDKSEEFERIPDVLSGVLRNTVDDTSRKRNLNV